MGDAVVRNSAACFRGGAEGTSRKHEWLMGVKECLKEWRGGDSLTFTLLYAWGGGGHCR